ncbi:MAG: glycosyltransferase [Gammaproteobacteria bacterium]|nr:glycosyltransferase [Gammaproteobacteria bacterium]
MKVLHIASGDLWAGAEVQLFTLASALNSMSDVDVEVVLLNHGRLEEELRIAGIEVSVIDESQFNGFKILAQLIKLIRKLKPDVIHTHRNKENILGSIAALLSGNIPTMRTAHGAPEHSPSWYHIPKRIILLLDWFCGRFLQKLIVAISEDLAGILAKYYPQAKIHVIQNGIDSDQVRLSAAEQPKKVNAKSDKYKIGIIGRLVPVKRVDLFIRTAHKLLEDNPELNMSFHIYGDGPLRDQLEIVNQQYKTHTQIHFEGHCHSILAELQNLDTLLMTSDHEGMPMTLLEAMVLQTPIVAHAVGGIPVLLDHGKCGLLVENHSPEGYAQAIIKLTNEPEFRSKMSNDALARVIDQYSSEQNAHAYRNQYMGLASV